MYNLENVKQTLFADYRKNEGPENFPEWLGMNTGGDFWERVRGLLNAKDPFTEAEQDGIFRELCNGLEDYELSGDRFEDDLLESVRYWGFKTDPGRERMYRKTGETMYPEIAAVVADRVVKDLPNDGYLVRFFWYEDDEEVTDTNSGTAAAYIAPGGDIFLPLNWKDGAGENPESLQAVPLCTWVRSDGRPAYIRNARPYAL